MFQVSSHSQKLGSFGPCHSECEKAGKVQYIYVYILYMPLCIISLTVSVMYFIQKVCSD